MPRNGDGSSDNGPIEGHSIIHGTSGNDTMEHTKKAAPMPEVEKGDGLEGMSASGGREMPKKGITGQGKAAADSNKPPPVDQVTK
ncbi:hypothetical protein COCMIDRAFT_82389 [Bipolaris oryzae ATCC 44560]|uniref:Uncharacterized protein n=1 Tax=Bipolaris oryzae ATCC 44560 TaxID=930090 RepID=W6ZEW8_COCMI|nr:uncharacterized protein COCMIDRAFT_82389 [Bipolaris oryzae ATCC 44560]EUC50367.1 hypothetical protein COCMIDRAFT_82389 [Bipolaris oryzae ATCC 44560]